MTGWILGSIAGAGSVTGLVIAIIYMWRTSTAKDKYIDRYFTCALGEQMAMAANQANLETITKLKRNLEEERAAHEVTQRDLEELAARAGGSIDAKRVYEGLRALSPKTGDSDG